MAHRHHLDPVGNGNPRYRIEGIRSGIRKEMNLGTKISIPSGRQTGVAGRPKSGSQGLPIERPVGGCQAESAKCRAKARFFFQKAVPQSHAGLFLCFQRLTHQKLGKNARKCPNFHRFFQKTWRKAVAEIRIGRNLKNTGRKRWVSETARSIAIRCDRLFCPLT